MPETILILGGGTGGVAAAFALREGLPRRCGIVLVNQEPDFHLGLSKLRILTGECTPEAITRPLARLRDRGIDFVQGEIRRFDPGRRIAEVDGKTLSGDYVIVAPGAELAPETVAGLAEGGYDFYTIRGADALRRSLEAFSGGRIVVLTAAVPYKCPPAPYEAAMLIEAVCRRRGVREKTQIDFYAAEAMPMGIAGPEVSAAVRATIEKKGIAYHPEHQVRRVVAASRRVLFANGEEAEYDLLAYVPPHRAPRFVRESGLVGEGGWVPVDRHTLSTHHPGVFAIGDVTGIPLSVGKPLPKAGVFARGEAETVARNIIRKITGKGEPAAFDGEGECYLETGDGMAALGQGSFFTEPAPRVTLHAPDPRWYEAKRRHEQEWLSRFEPGENASRQAG